MLRNILIVCPALVAASLVANPTMARPLTAELEPMNGPGQWEPIGKNPEQGIDLGTATALDACVQTQIFVGTNGDDRSYDCDTLTGPVCLAQCAGELEDRAATCRSQCEDGGALFCAPSELTPRWPGWHGFGNDDRPGIDFPDFDRPNFEPIDRPDFEPIDRPDFEPIDRPDFEPIDRPDFEPIDIDRPELEPVALEEVVFIDTSTCLQLDVKDV
ncbi:hypothetical protein [Nannocystis radixulma]|uniref:Uncharacterized protein n=1 Tax=Nannocystis radixulma TaxID=2995305 RepID=A0ABT5BK50_9BACT|nr:hypothetical protein [Nannocystis radixulma]MDC0674529.1 hypothetical protein [Nannocystis radixulma]